MKWQTRMVVLASPVLGLAFWDSAPAADVTVYSNFTNFSGNGFAQGGATLESGDNVTKVVADDVTPAAGFAGLNVDNFVFSVGNFNSTAVSARPLVVFYQADGASGGPGTPIAAFIINTLTFNPGSVQGFSVSGQTFFTLPSGTFWAGLAFDDNNGTSGASLAQLNNLGQGIFNPPTIGSSQDVIFQATDASSFSTSNPPGAFENFGGGPVANLGWQFSVNVIPEPSAGLLLAAGAFLGFARWRRGHRAKEAI